MRQCHSSMLIRSVVVYKKAEICGYLCSDKNLHNNAATNIILYINFVVHKYFAYGFFAWLLFYACAKLPTIEISRIFKHNN